MQIMPIVSAIARAKEMKRIQDELENAEDHLNVIKERKVLKYNTVAGLEESVSSAKEDNDIMADVEAQLSNFNW